MKNFYLLPKPFVFITMFLSLIFQPELLNAQDFSSEDFSGFTFRNIGPAFTSGRITDIAIDPVDENTWYVTVASGGVWKTTNNATTWTPIFDNEASYSIGCITIDPNNRNTLWVGTGENDGGRHIAFGDGVYRSLDGGQTWENMGLKASEHISKIIVKPGDPNTIWVASQGPLWSSGGERGVYKSTDGGKSWKKTLGGSEWTGATELVIDPENSDVLYAATWDRHRTVAAYMGGGPGSGLHKSVDGGETWTKLTKGIPSSNLGKIGLVMSPFDNQTLYAAIELDRRKGGVFMSTDGGYSWVKQSEAVSEGTGPHYYQELFASPHVEGRIYLMSNTAQISDNHGKTFVYMNEKNKHVDNHAMGFKMSNPNYVLFGTDGGLYQSYDHTKTWNFIGNLPLAQYYKVAVDDTEPFYNVYGGTQDNGSHGGPSRTMSSGGISNADWWKTLGADGHQSATEPGNPDITYGEFQQGRLWRIDQTTKETVLIQPQPAEGEPYERFNWDAPILVSPHKPSRLYFASYRVWKSEDRGDSWEPVSKDLTRNQERLSLPIMGKNQSWDNPWDVLAMSNYNTITSLAESPKQEGLIYAGTDDGIIQSSEDGGQNWRKTELGSIKGVPSTAFVNDVRADLFDANVVYAALDNHKYGDYKPYLIKSTNKGKSWSLINGDLPEKLLLWRLVQDHVNPKLMFLAAEYGIYFTYDGGNHWVQLKGGLPTISFRDITIQRREGDLVAASFGRGFYILDNIQPLRQMVETGNTQNITLFPVKEALWYKQVSPLGGRGDDEYYAKNPDFGAIFNYFLPEKHKSLEDIRKEKEKKMSSVPFPGWAALENEVRQEGPALVLVVKDADGNVVNRVKGTNKKGLNSVSWNLQHTARTGVTLGQSGGGGWYGGPLATPGKYSVTLTKVVDGNITALAGPVEFEVVRLFEGALEGAPYQEINAFRKEFEQFQQGYTSLSSDMNTSLSRINAMKLAYSKASGSNPALYKQLEDTRLALLALKMEISGSEVKGEIGERINPTISDGYSASSGLSGTYGPTPTHKKALSRAVSQMNNVRGSLDTIMQKFEGFENQLKEIGAPWVER